MLEPGTLITPTHRSDWDVPVLAAALGPAGRAAGHDGVPRPAFLVREDLLFRGFFAGFPERLPLAVRRAVWPVGIGPVLRRHLATVPAVRPDRALLVEVLRAMPDAPLSAVGPAGAAVVARARDLGAPEPLLGRDALRGDYADLLWRTVARADVTAPEAAGFWRARVDEGATRMRGLAQGLRAGRTALVFPEGNPPADGRHGPLASGLRGLVRRGRVQVVQPVVLAYDPLRRGRTAVSVVVCPPLRAPFDDVAAQVLAAWHRHAPLTAGGLAATAVVAGRAAIRGVELLEEVEAAGPRPLAADLRGPDAVRRLTHALRRAARLGAGDPGILRLAAEAEHVGLLRSEVPRHG